MLPTGAEFGFIQVEGKHEHYFKVDPRIQQPYIHFAVGTPVMFQVGTP